MRERIDDYRPRKPVHWEEVRDLVIAAVVAVNPPSWKVADEMLRTAFGFIVWTWKVGGKELTLEALFTERNIALYIQGRRNGRLTSRDRSQAQLLARMVERQTGVRPKSASHVHTTPSPYSKREVAELVSFAKTQRTAQQSQTTLAIVTLGLGAGLDTVDIERLRGTDIHDGFINIRGVDPGRRQVPVLPEWRQQVAALAAAGDSYVVLDHLARTDSRSGRSLVTEFLHNLEHGKPSVQRLRATWIAALIERGFGPLAILRAAGLKSFVSLDYFRDWMPKPSIDDLISQLDAITPNGTR